MRLKITQRDLCSLHTLLAFFSYEVKNIHFFQAFEPRRRFCGATAVTDDAARGSALSCRLRTITTLQRRSAALRASRQLALLGVSEASR